MNLSESNLAAALRKGNYIDDSLDKGGGVNYIKAINKGDWAMANRSSAENKELVYTVRVGGRVFAAFRARKWAEDCAYDAKQAFPDRMVEIEDRYDTLLTLKPVEVA